MLEWLWCHFLNDGILLTKACMGAVSTVTAEADIERFIDSLRKGLARLPAARAAAE